MADAYLEGGFFPVGAVASLEAEAGCTMITSSLDAGEEDDDDDDDDDDDGDDDDDVESVGVGASETPLPAASARSTVGGGAVTARSYLRRLALPSALDSTIDSCASALVAAEEFEALTSCV